MNILITNFFINSPTGTETYVYELAIELHNRGHHVEIFTLSMGDLAKSLIENGIHVCTDLKKLKKKPDCIHAHHNIVTLKAAHFFKKTPIVYFIHDRTHFLDYPFKHPNILQYVAVDYNCKERYCLENGFEDDDIEIIYNWVNLSRFKLRKTISATPRKALAFSNYMSQTNIFPSIKEACLSQNIEIELIGSGNGNATTTPENILGQYDIVFGKAKAAIEAMATGAAVIVCDFRGLAKIVTPENMLHYRKYNFGMKLMTNKIQTDLIIHEIKKYDPENILKVSNFIRKEADFLSIVSQLENTYSRVIVEYDNNKRGKYKLNYYNYLTIRKITFRIVMKIRLNYKFPKSYTFIKKHLNNFKNKR